MKLRAVRSTVLAALLGAASWQCSPPFVQPWQLTNFRVLGVRVEPPEPARGATITVSLATADVRQRDVQVLWVLCSAPRSGAPGGASPNCRPVTAPGLPVPDTRTTVMATVPVTGGGLDAGGHDAIEFFGFACAGGTFGFPDGGTTPTCEGTDAVGWAFTRTVRVRAATALDPPNQNPMISEVRFGLAGATQAVVPGGSIPAVPVCTDTSRRSACPKYQFQVAFDAASREMFHSEDINDGGVSVRPEHLVAGYVVDRGTLDGAFRADTDAMPVSLMDNDFRAPATPGDVNVFVYAADGRGGFDWTKRTIRVQ